MVYDGFRTLPMGNIGWTSEFADLRAPDSAPIKLISFTRDGRLVATADDRRVVRVWRGRHLIYEKRFRGLWDRVRSIDSVRAIEFEASGRFLVVAAGSRARRIDLFDGSERPIPGIGAFARFMGPCPEGVAVSKLSDIAIAYDGAVQLFYSERDCLRLRSVWSDNEAPCLLKYSYDNERLIGTDRYCVCVWDPALGIKVARLATEKVHALSVSPVNGLIAVRNLHKMSIWDTDSGELLALTQTLPGLPTLDWTRNGKYVAVGDREGFTIFDVRGMVAQRVPLPAQVLALKCSPAEDVLLAALANGSLTYWNYSKRALEAQ